MLVNTDFLESMIVRVARLEERVEENTDRVEKIGRVDAILGRAGAVVPRPRKRNREERHLRAVPPSQSMSGLFPSDPGPQGFMALVVYKGGAVAAAVAVAAVMTVGQHVAAYSPPASSVVSVVDVDQVMTQ